MDSSMLLSITTIVLGAAAFFYIAGWTFENSSLSVTGTLATVIGWIVSTAGIMLRWMESHAQGIGHAPLSNFYESLIIFTWALVGVSLAMECKYKNKMMGAFTLPLAFLAIAYASLPSTDKRIEPLIPALKSNWLIVHVMTCFISYAALAMACGISIMYLLKYRNTQTSSRFGGRIISLLPELNTLDRVTHQLITFGFLFLSVGMITGSVWANSAWGRYWGWDPKETWSFITWLIYASVVHARMARGWQGRRIAYLSIIGFTAVLFTYLGVNYLPGLHRYAGG